MFSKLRILKTLQRADTMSRRLLFVEELESRNLLSTFTVLNTDSSATGSLYWAIQEANAEPNSGGADVIDFAITGSGVHTIGVASGYELLITDPVVINGYSQSEAVPNTNSASEGTDAVLKIQLDGSSAGANAVGIKITADGSESEATVLLGLSIGGFGGAGIHVQDASSVAIFGNFIGLAADGSDAGNGADGIRIEDSPIVFVGGEENNIGTVGSPIWQNPHGNVVSYNGDNGIHVTGSDTGNVFISGNIVGLDQDATANAGNGASGVLIDGNASNVFVGRVFLPEEGDPTLRGNIISGNDLNGVSIDTATGDFVGPEIRLITISGNKIGVGATGLEVANGEDGIRVEDSVAVVIGGTTMETGNIIAGNAADGVHVLGGATDHVYVTGNAVGLDGIGNGGSGILIEDDASNVFVGSLVDGEDIFIGNVIIGNTIDGIKVQNVSGSVEPDTLRMVTISSNRIGLDADDKSVGNDQSGINIDNASAIIIGGTSSSYGNVVSGNSAHGVHIAGEGSTNVFLSSNKIGTTAYGEQMLRNLGDGVRIDGGASGVWVGRNSAFEGWAMGNLIAGNLSAGVRIVGDVENDTNGNFVAGNFIGLNEENEALGNLAGGVIIEGARDNWIGGTDAADRNVISGNGDEENESPGIWITGPTASENVVAGNYIGTNLAGTDDIGNSGAGVRIDQGAHSNLIGMGYRIAALLYQSAGELPVASFIGSDMLSGTRNVISGNRGDGITVVGLLDEEEAVEPSYRHEVDEPVLLAGTATAFNTISGNYIGTNAAGASAISNLGAGVGVETGAQFNFIGMIGYRRDTEQGNVISGNAEQGIRISGIGDGNFQPDIEEDPSSPFWFENAGTGNIFVFGNTIGISAGAEPSRVGNSWGVLVDFGATLVAIGVPAGQDAEGDFADPAVGNTISGNRDGGVWVKDLPTYTVVIGGNFIGTDVNGSTAIGNLGPGVKVSSDAMSTYIGGDPRSDSLGGPSSARNVISGNEKEGIVIDDVDPGEWSTLLASHELDAEDVFLTNFIAGNTIGLDPNGDELGNAKDGILISASASTFIGGMRPEWCINTISGNDGNGIRLTNGSTATIIGLNYIGTDSSGRELGNGTNGVLIEGGSTNNFVGGVFPDSVIEGLVGNVICDNAGAGILIRGVEGDSTSGNVVQGNHIGVFVEFGDDPDPPTALGNGTNGVEIGPYANGNTIGADVGDELDHAEWNEIAYNGENGVLVDSAIEIAIRGNAFFDNVALAIALTNAGNRDQVAPNLSSAVWDESDLLVEFAIASSNHYPALLQVYIADGDDEEGRKLVAVDLAPDDDTYVLRIENAGSLGIDENIALVATATDEDGNTSAFSTALSVPTPA